MDYLVRLQLYICKQLICSSCGQPRYTANIKGVLISMFVGHHNWRKKTAWGYCGTDQWEQLEPGGLDATEVTAKDGLEFVKEYPLFSASLPFYRCVDFLLLFVPFFLGGGGGENSRDNEQHMQHYPSLKKSWQCDLRNGWLWVPGWWVPFQVQDWKRRKELTKKSSKPFKSIIQTLTHTSLYIFSFTSTHIFVCITVSPVMFF